MKRKWLGVLLASFRFPDAQTIQSTAPPGFITRTASQGRLDIPIQRNFRTRMTSNVGPMV